LIDLSKVFRGPAGPCGVIGKRYLVARCFGLPGGVEALVLRPQLALAPEAARPIDMSRCSCCWTAAPQM
jgi:hypothetical protein